MPLMFGDPSPVSGSFIQPIISSLLEKRIIKLFSDEFRTPASATSASNGILMLLQKKLYGLFHLGGRERISRFDMGTLIADLLDLNQPLIQKCLQKDFHTLAPRPKDVSLDSSKAYAAGYNPKLLVEELRILKSISKIRQ